MLMQFREKDLQKATMGLGLACAVRSRTSCSEELPEHSWPKFQICFTLTFVSRCGGGMQRLLTRPTKLKWATRT